MSDEERDAIERWQNTGGFSESFPEDCVEPLHTLAAMAVRLVDENNTLKADARGDFDFT